MKTVAAGVSKYDFVAKIKERNDRSCVWDEGTVPDHVARFLWDAVDDRRVLLAALVEVAVEWQAPDPVTGMVRTMKETR